MSSVTNNTLNWIFKSIQIVAVIAMPVIAYVWTSVFERITVIEKDIVALRLESVKTANTHFTVTDWNAAKNTLDAKCLDMDKRITRTEDTTMHLKDLIVEMRMEQKEKLIEITNNQKELMQTLTPKPN